MRSIWEVIRKQVEQGKSVQFEQYGKLYPVELRDGWILYAILPDEKYQLDDRDLGSLHLDL